MHAGGRVYWLRQQPGGEDRERADFATCSIHLARLAIICDMLTTFLIGAIGDEAFLAPRSYA